MSLRDFLEGAPGRPNARPPEPAARARAEASVAALLAAIESAFLRSGRHAPVVFRVDGAAVQPVMLGDGPEALGEVRQMLGGADAAVAVRERGGELEAVVERAWAPAAVRRSWAVVRGRGPLRLGEPREGPSSAPRLLAA